jgi:hypothetical protein
MFSFLFCFKYKIKEKGGMREGEKEKKYINERSEEKSNRQRVLSLG